MTDHQRHALRTLVRIADGDRPAKLGDWGAAVWPDREFRSASKGGPYGASLALSPTCHRLMRDGYVHRVGAGYLPTETGREAAG